MPLIHEDMPSTGAPKVSVSGSVAIEIEWALASADRAEFRRDHAGLDAVYREHPDLEGRVRAIWGPEGAMSCGGFMELMVLAHHGGLLFSTDAGALLDGLEEWCTT